MADAPFQGHPGQRTTGKSLNAIRNDVRNLGFQFNDLATQIAAGTSPLPAIAQQGGQIAQTFAGVGGAMGALRSRNGGAFEPDHADHRRHRNRYDGVRSVLCRKSEEGAKEATEALDEQLAAVNRLREARGLEAVGKPIRFELFIAEREVLGTQVEDHGPARREGGGSAQVVRRHRSRQGEALEGNGKASDRGDFRSSGPARRTMRAGRPDLEALRQGDGQTSRRRGNLPENVKGLCRATGRSRNSKALCRRAISTNCEKP